ncbi:MAG: M28 family peptidase, partial [Bacteroidetes bacterium]|nr:M28 family peptidase [Bacteroidota bacterium]
GILLDMIGDAELEIPKEGFSVRYAPDIVQLVWETARNLNITQFKNEIGPEVIDDHLPLNEVGIKTINLIDFNYPDATHRYWHTLDDTPDKCSPESLEAVGVLLLNLIYRQY